VRGKTARQLADEAVNNYTFHQRNLALAAPSSFGQVKTTMAERYFPLLNGVWKSDAAAYDTGSLTDRQMARLIREQVYSTRRAAEFGYGSGGRIGFAWTEKVPGSSLTLLAANLARALHDAYVGDLPGSACVDNDGVGTFYFGCPPAPRTTATINTAWDAFKIWQAE
jgi:hypothetical protein